MLLCENTELNIKLFTFQVYKQNKQKKMSAGPINARSVYLVTYSQANIDRVPDRETFAHMIKLTKSLQ